MVVKKDKSEFEYVIPLRCAWKHVARYKRANKAIKEIKEFLVRHMKIRDRDLSKIKVDKYLNEFVWARGIKKPPIKVKVIAKKNADIVTVELVNLPDNLKFKKAREEKVDKNAKESMENKKSLMQKAKEGMQSTTTPGTEEEKNNLKGIPKGHETSDLKGTSEEEKKKAEKKQEEQEKKAAVVEAGAKMEKAAAKKSKHVASAKQKQPKRPQRMSLEK